jgi:two-component system NarL family response regulator
MRLLIVEDDTLLREHLSILLAGEPGFSLCGAYGSAEEALPMLVDSCPDVLISDIGLPGMTGIDLIRKSKQLLPDLDIIAYTIFDDRETLFQALKAGASGYMLKGSPPRQIIEAIIDLRDGGAPMSPKIARAVIREFQEAGHDGYAILTVREIEILHYLEKGNSAKIIADACCISFHTVATHIKNIYEKLHARSRQEAIVKARKKGIL